MPETLPAVIVDAARVAGETVAVAAPDARRTFAELARRIEALAGNIAARASSKGAIGVLAENSSAYVELLYAVPAAGRRLLLLNYRHHPREWAVMLERARVEIVFGDAALLDALRSTLPNDGIDLVALDGEAYSTLAHPEPRPVALPPVAPEAVAWLVPTSGTTGTPKLAMLTHRSLLTAAKGCAIARPVAADDVFLLAFPLCHIAAYNVLVQHLHARPLVLLSRFEPAAAVAVMRSEQVTSASLAPTMIAALLDMEHRDPSPTLRSIGYGSSGIPEPLLRRAIAELGCGFSQGYGMTELSGNAAFLNADQHRAGLDGRPDLLRSAGCATPLVELRIVDDDGAAVPPGTVGEIAARGDQVMAGYLDDPDATDVAIVAGWLHTGDLGTIDVDGVLTVVDRKKDVIVTGGENVASREVEAVLYTHPAVREVAVVGVPDAYYGEAVAALVVLRPGAETTPEDLVAHCRASLAGYKKPRRIEFVAELPKNTVGKIDKVRIRADLGQRA